MTSKFNPNKPLTKEFNLFDQLSDEDLTKEPTTDLQSSSLDEQLANVLDKVRQKKEDDNLETRRKVKRIIEALLFVSKVPLSFNRLREVCDTAYPLKPKVLHSLIGELQQEYISQDRSFRLEEIEGGYILKTCEEFGPYLQLFHREKRGEKLSSAATEVLAIIAYRQPITRPQIEAIRGIDSSGTVMSLLERGLIEPAGQLEAPGRPTLFTTTPAFLQYYGLKTLQDLPPIKG